MLLIDLIANYITLLEQINSLFVFLPAVNTAIIYMKIVPMSGLGLFFAFYLFSYGYLIWLEKRVFYQVYWSSAILHIVTNSLALFF